MKRLLRLEGLRVSYKRVHRLWRSDGLKVRKKPKKRRAQGQSAHACSQLRAERINDVWSWDLIFDRTTSGHSSKWLSIVDEYTRRCITLDIARSMTSEDVINRLSDLFVAYGVPECIRSDNGPELTARAIGRWLSLLNVKTLYVEPGESLAKRVLGEFPQSFPR